MSSHAKEVSEGKRFEFGKNWNNFLSLLNDDRISLAEKSLKEMLKIDNLEGMSFLDIGSGSGLFSLAARRLGARVHSFDYDPQSVACTSELKRRFYNDDDNWLVEQGNALDKEYIEGLGKFDIVYSWGVLHHTGDMWQALANASLPVADGGKLFIAIYNDQGGASRRWYTLKKVYNRSPKIIRWLIVLTILFYFEIRSSLIRLIRFQNPLPFKDWFNKKHTRGMNIWYDLIDWVGGFPFEVANPERIFDFYYNKDFNLISLKTCAGGLACNEFVFIKSK